MCVIFCYADIVSFFRAVMRTEPGLFHSFFPQNVKQNYPRPIWRSFRWKFFTEFLWIISVSLRLRVKFDVSLMTKNVLCIPRVCNVL